MQLKTFEQKHTFYIFQLFSCVCVNSPEKQTFIFAEPPLWFRHKLRHTCWTPSFSWSSHHGHIREGFGKFGSYLARLLFPSWGDCWLCAGRVPGQAHRGWRQAGCGGLHSCLVWPLPEDRTQVWSKWINVTSQPKCMYYCSYLRSGHTSINTYIYSSMNTWMLDFFAAAVTQPWKQECDVPKGGRGSSSSECYFPSEQELYFTASCVSTKEL